MVAAGNGEHLGIAARLYRLVKAEAQLVRHDLVFGAMGYEQGCGALPQVYVVAKSIAQKHLDGDDAGVKARHVEQVVVWRFEHHGIAFHPAGQP